ncbi:TonB-dependent receptor [Mucilaginibacter hurinus]|uniref:TonB-dependent receptor n=1 Tax=Mucilaginibacter hurinus TaxID=2201324 RepID=A0A367GL39_9SPHI|nr:TonB-dependent receptor plug domain-containing protein [Mucilaginibacter hurinus]RCH53715.1 TonB-dependent receptor [Mucilaginibacter hurinus]
MKKKISAVLLVLAGALLLSFNKVDDELIKTVAVQLDRWLSEHPQEKVHLHLDKPYYAAGEDIWFKAYVTVGPEHRLSAISGILNIELINSDDSIKQAIKLPLTSGLGWGDFNLPDTLAEGSYRIRAYTNWMRNAGDDYFFDKTITVLNAAANKVYTSTKYTYNNQTGRRQDSAIITYADINGNPYSNKEVSYRVENNNRSVEKGKGVTNAKGELTVNFANNSIQSTGLARMQTVIAIDGKEKVTKSIVIKALSDEVDIQFFPEGGYLVNGISSKVAFKATGADGLGKDVKGVIKDGTGKTITNFNSAHLGMGVFAFQPQAGSTYSARVTYADGSQKTVPLPVIKDAGYALSVDNSDTARVVLRILAANVAGNESLSVVAHSGGKLLYAAKTKPGGTGFMAAIPKARFPSGIVQFTLFSSAGEPLNERLIFVQQPDLLKLNISASKRVYSQREKVKLDITASTVKDSLIEGAFSAAVINETIVNADEANENTILTDILLTSDIKGYIEKPNYYFTNIGDQTRANLDILMLTQGYRRFEWKSILNANFSASRYQPEKTLDISGTVTQKGKPLAAAKVTLFSSTGGIFSADTVADANGRFRFKDLVFADSARMVVQASAANGKKNNVDIILDNIEPPGIAKNKNVGDIRANLNEGFSAYLQYSSKWYAAQLNSGMGVRTIVLKEVKVTEKKQVAKNSSNLNGSGNADQVITAKDLPLGCFRLDMCLQGRLVGVRFVNGRAFSTRGINTPMLIVVDGVYLSDDYLNVLNVNDVETVEVLRGIGRTAIYGAQGYGGVIIITTRRGGSNYDYLKRPAPGVISYTPKGYYVARTFYSPRYDDPKTNVQVADMRSTIYWNPNIITGKNGKASIEYFNAGSEGTYRVVIEGIDNDGRLGRLVYRYKVE